MKSYLITGAGILCLPAGLVFLPLPTPLGLPLIILGLSLLLVGSARARNLFKSIRRRRPNFSQKLDTVESRLPAHLRKVLRKTRPED